MEASQKRAEKVQTGSCLSTHYPVATLVCCQLCDMSHWLANMQHTWCFHGLAANVRLRYKARLCFDADFAAPEHAQEAQAGRGSAPLFLTSCTGPGNTSTNPGILSVPAVHGYIPVMMHTHASGPHEALRCSQKGNTASPQASCVLCCGCHPVQVCHLRHDLLLVTLGGAETALGCCCRMLGCSCLPVRDACRTGATAAPSLSVNAQRPQTRQHTSSCCLPAEFRAGCLQQLPASPDQAMVDQPAPATWYSHIGKIPHLTPSGRVRPLPVQQTPPEDMLQPSLISVLSYSRDASASGCSCCCASP